MNGLNKGTEWREISSYLCTGNIAYRHGLERNGCMGMGNPCSMICWEKERSFLFQTDCQEPHSLSDSRFRITRNGWELERREREDVEINRHTVICWSGLRHPDSGSLSFPWFVLPFFEFSLRSRGRDATTARMRSMGESAGREGSMHEAKQSDSRVSTAHCSLLVLLLHQSVATSITFFCILLLLRSLFRFSRLSLVRSCATPMLLCCIWTCLHLLMDSFLFLLPSYVRSCVWVLILVFAKKGREERTGSGNEKVGKGWREMDGLSVQRLTYRLTVSSLFPRTFESMRSRNCTLSLLVLCSRSPPRSSLRSNRRRARCGL